MSDEEKKVKKFASGPLAHRDDLPFEVAEAMVDHFKEMYPGFKVVFAGDQPVDQMPPGLLEESVKVEAKIDLSMTGQCMDCGEKAPPEGWVAGGETPEGWDEYTVPGDKFFLVCPKCKEGEEFIEIEY